ncbi:hypothetical protein TB2_028822 [Malus domestica]
MKGKAWTQKEDEALCRAYRWVLEDSVNDSSQTSECVWTRTSKKYYEFYEGTTPLKPRELFFKMKKNIFNQIHPGHCLAQSAADLCQHIRLRVCGSCHATNGKMHHRQPLELLRLHHEIVRHRDLLRVREHLVVVHVPQGPDVPHHVTHVSNGLYDVSGAGSPFFRIIMAPSQILRSASPRF